MSTGEAPRWTTYARERLANTGYRRGGGRNAVIDLLDEQECALSAQEIEVALRESDRKVGRATVYRVLEELDGLGLVSRVEIGDGVTRYESVFPDGIEHHHHFVCDTCGRLIPFVDDDLERAIRRIARREGFDVADHDVTLHGSCAECA
ncbi:MAG TPA: Fur family transcriptional regulator [Solirubrobacter sp.]|nr:Fur family transcriptional regulator [Solirubrobacter sp.]